MRILGPVPSRRLGQSLGINNIPPKNCSYSCVYCQLGRTNKMQVGRCAFYQPGELWQEAEQKIHNLRAERQPIDYLTFVSDGEPTLDENLGETIKLLKSFNIKIAVISNSSLIWRDDVKEDLLLADWVSLKVDAVDEGVWRIIDRPYGHLRLNDILYGIEDFAGVFKGMLVTETMLVKGLNDHPQCVRQTAEFLARIKPSKAYILVPTRPPAENVEKPDKGSLRQAARILRESAQTPVEFITGDEGEDFYLSQDPVTDILSITSVHPVREDVIELLLKKRNCDPDVVSELLKEGKLEKITYEGKNYLLRKS